MAVCFDVEIRCCDIRLGLGQIHFVWIHILASLCAHVCLCQSGCLVFVLPWSRWGQVRSGWIRGCVEVCRF